MADTPAQAALRAAFNSKVSINAQTLTAEQQLQVRTNIGAIGSDALSDYLTEVSASTTYLAIAGGTMTGALTLFADPSAPLGAATKQYVDNATSELAPLASPGFTGTVTVNGQQVATQDMLPDLSGYIPKTGSAGTVSAYTTPGTSASISASSPDASYTSSSVSVANGSSGTAWTKVVRLTASSPKVSLGSSWKWQGGSAPTLKRNGFLVLSWCGSGGIAVFNAVS